MHKAAGKHGQRFADSKGDRAFNRCRRCVRQNSTKVHFPCLDSPARHGPARPLLNLQSRHLRFRRLCCLNRRSFLRNHVFRDEATFHVKNAVLYNCQRLASFENGFSSDDFQASFNLDVLRNREIAFRRQRARLLYNNFPHVDVSIHVQRTSFLGARAAAWCHFQHNLVDCVCFAERSILLRHSSARHNQLIDFKCSGLHSHCATAVYGTDAGYCDIIFDRDSIRRRHCQIALHI